MIPESCNTGFAHALGSVCNPYPIYHAPAAVDATVQFMTGIAIGMSAVAVILVLILVFLQYNNRK